MALFTKAESTSAYLKAGFLGFAGSGKTFTATHLAIGLAKLINERQLKEAGRPIFFLDTETGSDYVTHRVREAGLELYAAKTRAFVDLLEAIGECEKAGSVLIIDSITHFWREFTEAYMKKRNRSRLEFQDWNVLKGEWGRFTDRFVNSSAHIIMCGRAGHEYDNEVNEDTGKREVVKTGIKMKAEGETGYEPSVLVLMEREMDVRTNAVTRSAYVMKERFGVIDGKVFKNPTFADFLPHIERLNLGGHQLGVDTARNSNEIFGPDGDTQWAYRKKQLAICLEEIQEEIVKMYPGQSAGDKKGKADLVEQLFGTRSWSAVGDKRLEDLQAARDRLWVISRGHPYGQAAPLPVEPIEDSDKIPHEATVAA